MCEGPYERTENGAGLLSLRTIWGAAGANASGAGPAAVPSARLSRLEQRIRKRAVAGGLGVLRPDAFDLCLEERDAVEQLVLRIGIERFAGQPARGISAHSGEIVVHCSAA